MSKPDCGCGCGGASAWPSAFVRPRFFAGQLLTEDDLSLLVEYVTGKTRLQNRMVSGPGVVCGLEVSCDPCGGGTVMVHPGHAIDCSGNDIVLSCKEKVDVAALVREMRVSSLGVDCGEPCEDDQRHYGLYVRYEETPAEPVAPYATEEPCPTPGCVPSRIQEGFRFVVKCETTDDHRYNPGTKLLAAVGDPEKYDAVRVRAQRLGRYLDPMFTTTAAPSRPVQFDGDDAARFTESLDWLAGAVDGVPQPVVARTMAENVRALASAVARYDTHDAEGQGQLRSTYQDLSRIDEARKVLGTACDRLSETNAEEVWPDPVRRSVAAAVVAETKSRVLTSDPESLEIRLLAHGTPVSNVLHAEFRADLAAIRAWLLGRLDRAPGVADCSLRDDVRGVSIPQPVPLPELDANQRLGVAELSHLAEASRDLTLALRRFVTDAVCSTLNPPCNDCTDTDVLLAHLELEGCDVQRACSATREQVLPGGSAYGEWLPKLYRLRELADRLCCQPSPSYQPPALPPDGAVPAPYVPGLLVEWRPRHDDVEEMWNLLLTRAPGETPPKPVHEQVYVVPSEVTDSMQELSALRGQVKDLTATVDTLRAQLDSARELMVQVREQLPERLGSRLEELESKPEGGEPEPEPEPAKPPARRTRSSGSTRKPRSGDSS